MLTRECMNAKVAVKLPGKRFLPSPSIGNVSSAGPMNGLSPMTLGRRRSGFSLVEACMATAVTGMSLLALFDTNAYQIRLVKSTREANAASLSLQERVESMRLSDWRRMIDATYVQGTLLASSAQSSGPLANLTETVTISAYPDASICEPLKVVHAQGRASVIQTAGAALSNQRIARVDFSLTWKNSSGATMQRGSSTLISNSGVSILNLNQTQATASAATTTPTTTTTTTPTTTTAATTTATTTPTTTTTTTATTTTTTTTPTTTTAATTTSPGKSAANPKGTAGGKNGQG